MDQSFPLFYLYNSHYHHFCRVCDFRNSIASCASVHVCDNCGDLFELLVYIYVAANPDTIYDSAIPLPPWVTYFQAMYMGLSSMFSYMLSSVLIQLWATLYSRRYLMNIEFYQKLMLSICVLLGTVFTIVYIYMCESYCLYFPYMWGSFIGACIACFVCPFFLGQVIWRLVRERIECQKLLTTSNLSLSFCYRMVFGFIVTFVLSIANMMLYINLDKKRMFVFYALSKADRYDINSLIGLFISMVYGTSNESLNVIADYLHRKFGTTWRQDLSIHSNSQTVDNGKRSIQIVKNNSMTTY